MTLQFKRNGYFSQAGHTSRPMTIEALKALHGCRRRRRGPGTGTSFLHGQVGRFSFRVIRSAGFGADVHLVAACEQRL